MSQAYKTKVKIRFHQADPAKIMFFGNLLALCHDSYEDFLAHMGISWNEYFKTPDHLIPIRHAECDYQRPFAVGEEFDLEISFARLGDSSFEVHYLYTQSGQVHAEARIVHVFLDAKSKAKTKIPDWFRSKAEVFLNPSLAKERS